jgi:short-subunit dehydrogenase involved in D-alanine esterification of teichoic acids
MCTIFIITAALFVKQTMQEIRRQQPDACLEAFQVDLSSYMSIKKFETSLSQWIRASNQEPSIQLLINNAGILAKSHLLTEDGIDEYVLNLNLFLGKKRVPQTTCSSGISVTYVFLYLLESCPSEP